MTIVDISKAFDTVPHTMTGDKHLKAKGVLTIVSRYVEKCTKTIYCRSKETVNVDLLRGVKQGDPLSSLLFNLAITPMISIEMRTSPC